MKRSQIAAGNFTYKYFPFTDFLDSMERLGLRKIELWSAEPHLYFEDYNYAQMTEIARKIRNRNLEVCCVTPEQYLYPVSYTHLLLRSLRHGPTIHQVLFLMNRQLPLRQKSQNIYMELLKG